MKERRGIQELMVYGVIGEMTKNKKNWPSACRLISGQPMPERLREWD